MKYSVIVPVYNRPQEISELLQSLLLQTNRDFEVVVVEDGSSNRCEDVVDQYRNKLKIQYLFKPNSGPGPSRNEGAKLATGNYFVFFDSDCIVPPHYFEAVEKAIAESGFDGWGGPDKAHDNFTILQRAMGYTMASVLTTGGIRGGKKSIGWFQPRSFNMGISRKVFETTGGFHFSRFAEDIELSFRMKNSGFRIGLIPDAFVYHKRRTNFSQFYRQVFNFGRGRVLVGDAHPGAVKLAHWFPAIFTLGTFVTVLLLFVNTFWFKLALGGFLFYFLLIFLHALFVSGNVAVAVLSIPSALIQFFGYGFGFLKEYFSRRH